MITEKQLSELRAAVACRTDTASAKQRRAHNVVQFNHIPRTYQGEPLKVFEKEFQLKYDNIFMKGPGKESIQRYDKDGNPKGVVFPEDLRPVIPQIPGLEEGLRDLTANAVFTTSDILLERKPEYADILISLIACATFLCFEKVRLETEIEIVLPDTDIAEQLRAGKKVSHLYHNRYSVVGKFPYSLDLHMANFSDEVWTTLNEMFDMTGTHFEGLTFRHYFRYLELFLHNEDSKMDFQGKNGLTHQTKKNENIGRVNTGLSALASIALSKGLIHSPVTITKMFDNITRMGGMRPIDLEILEALAPDLIHIEKNT